jgi:glycosyltransferase involved in cell wall biosynthesis
VVTLRGSVTDPKPALAGAEVLVLPSEAEGFGLVLIEAMAAGVAVVATDAPGIRDVVRDGETGILVPVGSPAALAEGIRRVLEDSGLRGRLVSAAFADARRRFTWDAAVAGYRQLLGI